MRKAFRRLLAIGVVVAAVLFCLRVLFPLPDISDRGASFSAPADGTTALGSFMIAEQSQHPEGFTGVRSLERNDDALISRLSLIEEAEVSLDVQYYIWHDDVSGVILLDALDRAAQRGVHVRLLLDDNGIPGMDGILATLNDHENFEVRIYNPSTIRTPKLLGYSFDFFRINRRMHNKALIADGAAAIIGGRNIGDEYFQVGVENFYFDLDVLAIGTAVEEVRQIFDDFWNSGSVFEAETIFTADVDRAAFDAWVAEILAREDAREIAALATETGLVTEGAFGNFEWTAVQVVGDSPLKGEGIAVDDDLMINQLGAVLGDVDTRLLLASAYFVPGEAGTEYFNSLEARGVEVEILTNALDTTDVFLVHAGYSRYRRELLEGGIDLYELKLRGAPTESEAFQVLPFGLTGASLHAKTFSVDDDRVFVGSFNFDPRSALLNTEMGFLIDSPDMAARMSRHFENTIVTVSYQPRLTPNGNMVWLDEQVDGDTITYQREPGASWFQQVSFAVVGLLPIEWLL